MSKSIDVLAVMDREVARAGGESYSDGRDLIEARAAVAELIEAALAVSESCAKHYGAAMSLHLDVAGSGGKNERLQAALSLVRGGK